MVIVTEGDTLTVVIAVTGVVEEPGALALGTITLGGVAINISSSSLSRSNSSDPAPKAVVAVIGREAVTLGLYPAPMGPLTLVVTFGLLGVVGDGVVAGLSKRGVMSGSGSTLPRVGGLGRGDTFAPFGLAIAVLG